MIAVFQLNVFIRSTLFLIYIFIYSLIINDYFYNYNSNNFINCFSQNLFYYFLGEKIARGIKYSEKKI